MKKIQMVELHDQYLRHKEEIDSAIQGVIDSSAFIKGEPLRHFQHELASYLGLEYAIGCGNGTDALQVALMALELEPGDEIITSPFTFIATVEVISLLKLTPVLVDVDPQTFNIDVTKIEAAISPKTKVILPVHLFGQAAHMQPILEIAQEHNLYIVEDNAQALGATYYFEDGSSRKTGTIGHIGCTSFFPSKNLGAFGDGGAIFTVNQEINDKIAAMVNHGMVKKYQYDHVGVNSRLDTMQAAILRAKLQHLDQYNLERQNVARAYNNAFADIEAVETPYRSGYSEHIYHQYTLQINDGSRDNLKEYLASNDIPSMIYYPHPLHLQKAYAVLKYQEGDFPVTESLCKKVLSLPMHTEMEDEQLDHIIKTVKGFFR